MYTNVNLAAPLGALALLGTGILLLTAGLTLGYSIVMKKFRLAKFALLTIGLVAAVYLAVLLIFSFASNEKVLAQGEEKHFCEIDCHLAYSVTQIIDTKVVGEAPNQVTAAGMFRVLTIKSRFDETTIGRNRGDALLYPNSRVVTISDENGTQGNIIITGQARTSIARSREHRVGRELDRGHRFAGVSTSHRR